MNLERAKMILIIAFAGLNLFLAYHLFWPDFGRLTRVAISADDLRTLEQLLNESNYYLNSNLDRSVRTGNFITVSTALDFQRKVLLRFLQEGAEFSHSEQATFYRKEEKTAIIQSTGLIRVMYTPPMKIIENGASFEQREVRAQVESFLTEQQLKPPGAVYNTLTIDDDGDYVLDYYQEIDGLAVYAGHLKVKLTGDRLKSVDIYWLSPVEREPAQEMEVINAAEALSNLVRALGPSEEPQYITNMTLGYFSGEYDAEKWEIPPVWRIIMQSGKIYYINAFTGNLERDSVIPEQLP